MTTLELFRKHRKGEVSRERFLYEVRRDSNLPWVTNTTSYDDAVKILKNKGIIREAQFEPQNIATDPAVDRVNPYALKREVEKLLSKEKVLTNDSYKEALNKAAKKLTDPQAVKNAMFANAESVAKADANLQTQEVKKANHVDKKNAMKKAKGQQMPKATAAPTKENRKTKKPKGVEIMKDKGVEGSEKIIKEISEYLKKKLNLSENNPYHDHSVGQQVPTPHGQGVIKEINGGTLCVEVDGKLYDVQMNVVEKLKQEQKEQSYEESGIDQNIEGAEVNQLEEASVPLQVGDTVLVIYPNEYEGETGEVLEVHSGFIVVEMQNGDTVSMHASDVELFDDDDNFGYDDQDLEEKVGQVVDKSTGDTVKLTRDTSTAQQFVNTQDPNVRNQLTIRR